jgi:DNA repair exonuclease SbcCD nuclease subunit
MFRFLHAADIHLDSPLRGLQRYEGAPVEAIRQATRRALENLVRLAIDERVAFVVVAGDLYDGDWKEFRTGLYFVAQMVKLREAGVPVYLIAGNHDAANKMTRRLPLPDNVRILSHQRPETVILPDWDVAIHGQSFAQGAVLENLSLHYPAAVSGLFNIGLLHTAATGREGHEPYAPCTVEGLRAKQYDYWALGHVHTREMLCDDPPILFPGNIQGRHIRETGPKGCTLVSVDDRHAVTVQAQALDVFRWEHCRVDASAAASGDDLLDSVRQRLDTLVAESEGRALAVRVEVAGPCRAHRALAAEPHRWTNEIRALAQDVGGGSLWIEKVQLRTAPPQEPAQASLDGPLGELVGLLAELKADPRQISALGGEIAELWEKLPPELSEGPDAPGLDRPQRLREMLDQVEQMLIHQLLPREGPA